MKLGLLSIMAMICLIGYTVASEQASMHAKVPAEGLVQIGGAANPFPKNATWIGGPAQTMEGLKGKVVLLYFMAPGCGTCDAFAPHLYRQILAHKDTLQVIGVSDADTPTLEAYAKKALGNYPILQDRERTFTNRYIGEITKFPYVVLINAEGKLAWHGRAKFQEQITREIKRVLGEKPVKVEPRKKQYALVIGRRFGYHGQLLKAPLHDANAVAEVLKPKFDEVIVLTDAPAAPSTTQPTADRIRASLDRLAQKAGKDGAVVVYYSGGCVQMQLDGPSKRDLFLSTAGGDLTLNHLRAALDKHDVQSRLVMVDVSQVDDNGGTLRDIDDALEAGLPDLPLLLSTACYDNSYTIKAKDGQRTTLFCKQVCEALQKGPISPEELFRTVRNGMSEWNRTDGRMQSPMQLNRDSKYAAFAIAAADTPEKPVKEVESDKSTKEEKSPAQPKEVTLPAVKDVKKPVQKPTAGAVKDEKSEATKATADPVTAESSEKQVVDESEESGESGKSPVE